MAATLYVGVLGFLSTCFILSNSARPPFLTDCRLGVSKSLKVKTLALTCTKMVRKRSAGISESSLLFKKGSKRRVSSAMTLCIRLVRVSCTRNYHPRTSARRWPQTARWRECAAA